MNQQKVFMRGEVLTRDDLIAIHDGYMYLSSNTTDNEESYKFLVAAGAVESMIQFLDRGKVDIEGNKRD